MRRHLADWEKGDEFTWYYSRKHILQFSPRSHAILEIQSEQDLETLMKIYAKSVLLGDQSNDSWKIEYARDFDMTNDSRLFPPRPKWEEWGYRSDEYSRWVKGPWKPIEQLYSELGVRPVPENGRRIAQPPHDRLACPRTFLPPGIILSREATHFIDEHEVADVEHKEANGRLLKIKIQRANGKKEETQLCLVHAWFSPTSLSTHAFHRTHIWRRLWAVSPHERLRLRCVLEALTAFTYGVDWETYRSVLSSCDLQCQALSRDGSVELPEKGFWRVDKDKPPEHRHTILSLVAFHDLQDKIAAAGGDVEAGIEAFCNQNDGEGWMLPETLRLADYGLGHDERAEQHQPVRECFGPRFYDWQLVQSPEESWRECHLHARNLLGAEGYQALLDELEGRSPPEPAPKKKGRQGKLFETDDTPLFDR